MTTHAPGARRATTSLLVAPLLLAACGGGGGGGASVPPGAGGGGSSGGPDLLVQSLTFSPGAAQTGDALHVVDVVANVGHESATSFQVSIYLSSDPFVNSSDVLLGVRNLGVLSPGATSSGGGFLTVPAGVSDGTWYVGAIVDGAGLVSEDDEANNSLVASATLEVAEAELPDLAPTSLSFSPSSVESGQQVTVSDTVTNLGLGDAGSFQVGIYLSSDPEITSGDTLIGLRSVPELGAGELSFLSAALTVPANLAAGSWYVGALADVGGSRLESDEFNNSLAASGELFVTNPPRPDLIVTAFSFAPSQVDAGQSLSVDETVANQGLVAAGPFRVGVYLSEDTDVTTDDRLIGFRSVAGLDVGASSVASAPLTVPSDTPGGVYFVGAIADHEGGVLEEDEDNNVVVALGTVEVFVPPMPDLSPVAVTFGPTALEAGQDVTVVERVRNAGVVDAMNVRVGVYLSPNPIVSTSDVLLGSRTIASLSPGSESESVSVYSLPAGLSTGSWTLAVIADDLDALPEPNEGDNLLLAAGHLDVVGSPDPKPDLLLSTLEAAPNSVISGGQLTVQSVVRNEGDLSAPGFQVEFYLSVDDVIEPTDLLVGTRTIFGLGIDQGSAQSFPYTLDASLPLGTYHFGALVDPAGAVAESDEENNSKLALGTVELYVPPPPAPDLVLTSLDLSPTSAAPGDTLQIDDVVKNQGDLDAGTFHVSYYLSDDAEVTADDTLIGVGLSVPSLALGSEAPSSTQLAVPAGIAPGTWSLGAIVTLDSGTQESDTTNNTLVASQTLEVTP